jgi:hypothetical protein
MTNDNQTNPALTPKNQDRYNAAIAKGLESLAAGGSKADAARVIYEMIEDEERDVIVQAFIDGANVTVKGAPTYFYNVRRQIERKRREEEKKPPAKSKKKSADPVS